MARSLLAMDGSDNLKPYGVINRFLGKVIWVRVTKTNNNPSVVATFYVDTLKKEKKNRLRTDCGTENDVLAATQCYLY